MLGQLRLSTIKELVVPQVLHVIQTHVSLPIALKVQFTPSESIILPVHGDAGLKYSWLHGHEDEIRCVPPIQPPSWYLWCVGRKNTRS